MIEEMETYLMGRSIDGIRTSGRSTVVPVQSRILSLLCMFSILLSYYKISRLHLSGICVNTHTHTHTIQARYITNYFLNIKELAACSPPIYLLLILIFHLYYPVPVRIG